MKINNVETKKPFYKKGWFIAIAIVIIIIIITNINTEKVDWSSLELGEYLPEPKKAYGEVYSNEDDYLSIKIEISDEKYFKEYVEACIGKGYTVDSEKTESSYKAFNNEGYKITLYEMTDEYSIHLDAPEKMSQITWPVKGIAAKLPKTTSNYGKITSDSSDCFRVTIGNTTIDDYNYYIKKCEDKGFNVDYHKSEKSYEAKNSDGYRLNISYLGANKIDIMIQIPKEETTNNSNNIENTKSSEETSEEKYSKKNSANDQMSKEFKEAMDSYEEFIDEYVKFMKKYAKSNGADVSLISDYSKYVTKYAELCEEFAEWEDEDLNTAETKYYIDVQARVSKKLLEVAN